jgi:hypothetical protein
LTLDLLGQHVYLESHYPSLNIFYLHIKLDHKESYYISTSQGKKAFSSVKCTCSINTKIYIYIHTHTYIYTYIYICTFSWQELRAYYMNLRVLPGFIDLILLTSQWGQHYYHHFTYKEIGGREVKWPAQVNLLSRQACSLMWIWLAGSSHVHLTLKNIICINKINSFIYIVIY